MLQTIATRPKENPLFERFQRQFMLCTVRRKAARTDVCVGQTLAVGRVLAPAEAAHPELIFLRLSPVDLMVLLKLFGGVRDSGVTMQTE